MVFKQYSDFAAAQWQQAMSESEHFSLEKCTVSEKVAVWDKMSETYDLAMGADPRRIDAAIERLERLGAFGPEKTALDIGSGTGAYTLELAKRCKTVYALDSSEGMQKVLAEKADRLGIKNIIPLPLDWSSVKPHELPCGFDIVLSSLNTGISDEASLVKMNHVSRGFCCYASACGTATNSARTAFQKLVFGRRLHAAGGNDIIHAFNIIYGLGYRPELTYAPCDWTKEELPIAAFGAVCREYGRYGELSEETKAALLEYIMTHLNERGLFEQSQKATVGIMIWNTAV